MRFDLRYKKHACPLNRGHMPLGWSVEQTDRRLVLLLRLRHSFCWQQISRLQLLMCHHRRYSGCQLLVHASPSVPWPGSSHSANTIPFHAKPSRCHSKTPLGNKVQPPLPKRPSLRSGRLKIYRFRRCIAYTRRKH